MTWWRRNRPDTADLFERELEDAVKKVAAEPHAGVRYRSVSGTVIYRLLLPKTQQHIYFSTDADSPARIVHTLWGARRGQEPKL